MARLILLVLTCACWQALATTIPLARNGQPAATIVVPADPAPRLLVAARDLQHYVKAVCGVELPLHTDGTRVAGAGLYVGQGEWSTASDLPPAGLNPETYAIRVRDGSVFFTGRWPTPVCFAIYSFIEEALGVRWFAPGALWEYVPRVRQGELAVEVTEVVRVPDTSPRIWSGHAWTESWQRWNLRNKTVESEVVPRRQFQNFLHRVFPPDKYAAEHPEYYPLISGKRWIPPAGGGPLWRPCESNPEVLRLTVEYARKWFDDNPNVDSFSLGMDDISHLCGCPECRAMDAHPDSYEKRQFSDRHYKFVNAVAREVARTHPDRYIGTLIYSIARNLPETVERLEDNVFGFITETSAAWWMEGQKEADHAITREWAKRCKHLSRYDYYGFACITPRFYPHFMDEQIKFDKSLGLEGMYTEVYTFLPHTAPMIWALARLQWDHTLSIDDLLGEFYAKMYGPAAPIMKQYFDLLERSYCTLRPGRGAWEHRNLKNQALAMSVEDLDRGLELLQQAVNATGDPDVQERVSIHRAALVYGGYAVRAYDLSHQLASMVVLDRQSADRALALGAHMTRLSRERERFWAEAAQRDDLLGETIRGLDSINYIARNQIVDLESGGLIGLIRTLAWYERNAPEALAVAAAPLVEAPGSLGEMVRAWRWVAAEKPPNLVLNAGFEETDPNTGPPEGDWRTEGAPASWHVWSSTPDTRFEVQAGVGQNGSAAAVITASLSSCLLQSHPANPGERYLCVCWVKAEPGCAARLSVRFRTAQEEWLNQPDAELQASLIEGQTGWQPLVVLVTVPEGAASLLVMPGAGNQTPGARAVIDDVALYRLPPG